MIKIGLLSDTHSYLNPKILTYFKEVDQIWHAGDIGSLEVIEELEKIAPVRAVFGNIDNAQIRRIYKETEEFMVENVSILMTHIGGYPGNYAPPIKQRIYEKQPKLFISGHSHILKIMNDKTLNMLHMNPGAAGKSGFHNIATVLRFCIDVEQISDLEVIEFNKRPVE
ncbi:MAG: metallophosphoesterase family protein [Salinivirgaceae bacterium]|jgi:putative phosphoesterase|nr:metallophosphoesterase family protein [Salinivirgaceae bacterium]MDD4747719.1 metallophosphoesterase family protein [Salinivirgaceae bacterium]MDY0279509.1 metallophosphoesterase family protein [Salinivirgaceae bacterium]